MPLLNKRSQEKFAKVKKSGEPSGTKAPKKQQKSKKVKKAVRSKDLHRSRKSRKS